MFLHTHFSGHPRGDLLDDVIRNLRHVLGTKRGHGYFLPSFGLTDVGHRTPEEMVVALTAEIAENIRLYEPRVELVDIDEQYEEEGRRVRLVVHVRLREAGERLRIAFHIPEGRFDIEPVGAAREG